MATQYPRNCYCASGVQSSTPGFCGTCEVCGVPGHLCHVPAPLPYTGSWCDEHYDAIAWAFDDQRPKEQSTYCITKGRNLDLDEDYLLEVQRDMAIRIVRRSASVTTRYFHGEIGIGFSPWTSPLNSWGVVCQPLLMAEFDLAWSTASDHRYDLNDDQADVESDDGPTN